MKIPVAEKIGLDSGPWMAIGIRNDTEQNVHHLLGSLMIQVESKHRSCQLKTLPPQNGVFLVPCGC